MDTEENLTIDESQTPNEDRLISIDKVALMLGRSVFTIRRWANQGTLPAVRVGPPQRKTRMFRLSDIRKIMNPEEEKNETI